MDWEQHEERRGGDVVDEYLVAYRNPLLVLPLICRIRRCGSGNVIVVKGTVSCDAVGEKNVRDIVVNGIVVENMIVIDIDPRYKLFLPPK